MVREGPGHLTARPDEDDALVALCAALNAEDPGVRPVPEDHMRRTLAMFRQEPWRGVACVLGGDDRKTLFCVSMDPDRGSETGPKSQSYLDAAVVEVPGAGYP